MRVVFSPELFQLYFQTSAFRAVRQPEELLLIGLFERIDNVLVFSKQLIDHLEEALGVNNKDGFQAFIKACSDNGKLTSVLTTSKSLNSEEIVGSIVDGCTLPCYIFVRSCNSSMANAIKTKRNKRVASFDNVSTCNISRVFFDLALTRCSSIRSSNFNSQNDLERFFAEILNIWGTQEVSIVDSYCNLHMHKNLDSVAKKGIRIKYFTSKRNKTNDELKRIRDDVKQKFGATNVELWVTSRSDLVHERLVMTDQCLLLDSTHDLASVIRSNSNWTVYISNGNRNIDDVRNKCSCYSRN